LFANYFITVCISPGLRLEVPGLTPGRSVLGYSTRVINFSLAQGVWWCPGNIWLLAALKYHHKL